MYGELEPMPGKWDQDEADLQNFDEASAEFMDLATVDWLEEREGRPVED